MLMFKSWLDFQDLNRALENAKKVILSSKRCLKHTLEISDRQVIKNLNPKLLTNVVLNNLIKTSV